MDRFRIMADGVGFQLIEMTNGREGKMLIGFLTLAMAEMRLTVRVRALNRSSLMGSMRAPRRTAQLLGQ
jgi:hypothetical protein